MILTIGNNLSKFESQYSQKSDSIIASPSFNQSSIDLLSTYIKTDFTYQIYKLYPQKVIKYYDKLGQKLYQVNQNYNSTTWQLTATTKPFAGYTCRKATTLFAGRKWEAWFTTEVPVSDGPYKFMGLPGLIIEIYDIDKDYNFSLLQLKKTTSLNTIKLPNNTPTTDQSSYNKGKADYRLQGVTKVATNGNSPEVARQLIENYKLKQLHKNNPLEIK